MLFSKPTRARPFLATFRRGFKKWWLTPLRAKLYEDYEEPLSIMLGRRIKKEIKMHQ